MNIYLYLKSPDIYDTLLSRIPLILNIYYVILEYDNFGFILYIHKFISKEFTL